jgi:tetratricopeptide (TPR) repeat protein
MVAVRATQADALHANGRLVEAKHLFADAKRRQKERQPKNPFLYSLAGYRYCDLLLTMGEHVTARDNALKAIAVARKNNWLLAIALDTLILGRAALGLVVGSRSPPAISVGNVRAALSWLDDAVDGLRTAGQIDDLPRGLLARAAFCIRIGNWEGAIRDLNEVEEIAEPGPMRLFLCDMALERARLVFAKIEAFAPLNGMLEKDNPPKPEVPSAEEIAKLREEAAKQIKIAADYIQTCGYHRRDEELAELREVLAGKRTFASLPPRV